MKSRVIVPAVSRGKLSGAALRMVLWAVVAVFGLPAGWLHAQSASSLYKQAQVAETHEDYDAAYTLYQKAYAKAPKDLRYREAYYRMRVPASALHMSKGRKLAQAGDDQGALVEFLHAAEIDPGNEAAQQEVTRVRARLGEAAATETSLQEADRSRDEINSMGAPTALKPMSNEPLTLHMSEDAKVIYQAIGRAAGINVLFDPDYANMPKRIQVDLNSVSLLDALRIVGTMSNTFWRPVTSNSIFVAQNTRAKRTELDEQAVQTFYLSNVSQQNDLNDVQTALRNVMPNAKVYGAAGQNAIVMRGTPDELLLAQKLVDDLDKARPEVVVDIAIMEVSKNWERNLGLSWPSSAGVQLQPNTTSTTNNCAAGDTSCTNTTNNPTLSNLAHLNSNNFSVTLGAATANLLLTDSNTKILQNPRIRATDQQKATMKIGERIPVATGSYQTGAAVSAVSSLVNTQFQYIDIGVNIEVTPTIHYNHDVTLKIKVEDSSEGNQVNISGVTEPIIVQKTSEQTIRLREGEASILGGILEQQDLVSWGGIPGLSSIPLLKYLFGSKDHTITDDELVFLVVPHIVRSQALDPVNLRMIDTGVGQSIDLRRQTSEGLAGAPAQAPAPRSSAVRQPAVGAIPAQTAQAALPTALAQLRNAATADPSAMQAVPPRPAPVMATPPPAASGPAGQPVPAAPVAAQPSAVPAGGTAFTLTAPPGPVTTGTTFQVQVVLNGAADVASVPLQIKFDPGVLSLVSVGLGDLLGRDGQPVALAHREDDTTGLITLNSSRPPGAKGVSGSGSVCVLNFQAKSVGTSTIDITHPAAVNSAQQQVPVQGARASVQVK